jgi:hypothetical protein
MDRLVTFAAFAEASRRAAAGEAVGATESVLLQAAAKAAMAARMTMERIESSLWCG